MLHDLWREFARPLGDATLLLAMVGFALLVRLAVAAGLLGLWLLIVILPALLRYLLALLESRAAGRTVQPPGIEQFSWTGGGALVPGLFALAAAGSAWALGDAWGPSVRWAAFAALGLVLPAVASVYAITGSPLACLNPAAWLRYAGLAGASYLAGPLALAGGAVLVMLGYAAGLPGLLLDVLIVYTLFSSFLVMGAVVAATGAAATGRLVGGRADDLPGTGRGADRHRAAALDHAYGMISRGNLDGGLAHLRDAADREAVPCDACRWYFQRMLSWDSPRAALWFARDYLGRLLDERREGEIVKLLARCLHEDPAFRPLPADHSRVLAVLDRLGREDLVGALGPRAG